MIQLLGNTAQFQSEVTLRHRGTMPRQPHHQVFAQRTTGQQCGLHGDRVTHIHRIEARRDEHRTPVGMSGFGVRCFDGQRP